MAARPPLAELLSEAEAARHRLLLGAAVVSARDANGEQVVYHPADGSKIEAYIAELKAKLIGRRPVNTIQFRTSKGL